MAEKEKEKKDKKPLNVMLILQIVIAVVNVAVVGGGTYMVYVSTLGWKAPSINEEQLQKELEDKQNSDSNVQSGPLIYTMDKFTVNLEGEPKRTIRLEINLEMLGKDGFEEIISTDNRAKARDRIVKLLGEKNFADLESIQGKLFLKDRIAMEMNTILDKGVVKDVYFSEFIVQ